MRKRYLSALVAVLCVLVLSVPSFAATVTVESLGSMASLLTPSAHYDDTYVIKVKTDSFTTAQLENWNEMMKEASSPTGRSLLVRFDTKAKIMSLILFDPSETFLDNNHSSGQSCTLKGFPRSLIVLKSTDGLVFDVITGSVQNTPSTSVALLSSVTDGGIFFYTNDPDLPWHDHIPFFSDVNALLFNDDPAPSEPETPSSSLPIEPPTDPYEPAGPPPSNNVSSEYLPYDTSIWDAFMWYLRDVIGGAGRLLLLIMFMLSIIPVILGIIRHSLGSRDDHGGDLL